MASNAVKVDFLSNDEVTKTLRKIEKGVDKLTKTTVKQTKKQKKSWLDVSTAINTAFGFTLANVLQSAARAIQDFVGDGIKAAIDMERQMQALEIQLGSLSNTILIDLRQATNSMVSDLQLAQATNRAMALGLKADNLPELFKVAAARAKVMGISVTQATNDIVTGIGRASPLILDNLGIIFSAEEVYTSYAKAVGKTVDSLTKAEKALALQNAVIESSQGIVAQFAVRTETLGDKIERMQAKVDNLQESIGTLVTRSMVGWSIAFEKTEDSLKRTDPLLIRYRDQIQQSTAEVERLSQSMGTLEGQLNSLQSALSGIAGQETQAQVEAQREINTLVLEQLQLKQQLSEFAGLELNDVRQVTLETGEQAFLSLEQLQKRIDGLSTEKDIRLEIIELETARKKVALDESIVNAEDQTLLEKNKTTIETIQEQLANKLVEAQNITVELKLQRDWLENQVIFTEELVRLENERADAIERQAEQIERQARSALSVWSGIGLDGSGYGVGGSW